ncbi:MAG TPA: hypothetical protein VEM38_02930 [Burkholderiales bacterium]|nr:hypothetical protein [Burkholderiales bacterium]
MEASSGRSRVRPIVVDFLATLLVTFCIGVAAAVVLGACAMLMAGAARGAEPGELAPMPKMDAAREGTRAEETRAKAAELTLTHHLVTKYASLIAIERTPARPVNRDAGAPAQTPSQANQGSVIPRNPERCTDVTPWKERRFSCAGRWQSPDAGVGFPETRICLVQGGN